MNFPPHIHLTDHQQQQIAQLAQRSALRKGDYLIQPGELVKGISYVESGCLRLGSKEAETAITLHFFTEGNWVTDLESLFAQAPAQCAVDAIEPTVVQTLSLQSIHYLLDLDPGFKTLHGLLTDSVVPVSQWRLRQRLTPLERYQQLLQEHPSWLNRFKLSDIASLLGMTPETLSRVRAKIS